MIFAKNFARNYEKKIILWTSDAWSMSSLSQRPSDQAYYIEDCRIFERESEMPEQGCLASPMADLDFINHNYFIFK